ncbi:response regulator transcription factor [Trueperella bialowiezensis]|uniref:Transcriptional activator protein CopR n=1 Tax=Trueperella bialowiezensis TaxID=312285 RepID=A0A3S4V5V5_9ACTO|nr:response regulator transcription factor [Trueperella bialowiezensis]VEI12747.1 Transcriptional activator protein CopR [Trueperella bialowiezensis]
MANILVIEDEVGISTFIAKGLKAAGYQTTVVATGREGVLHLLTDGYDLAILDIGLPDIDGFEVLEQARGQGVSIPVIILTARSSVEDTVSGLESGADDYMAKPFRFEELLARVRLRLRSARTNTPTTDTSLITVGDLMLDLRSRRVNVAGVEKELSAREFAMLEFFMTHPDQVLSRAQLLDNVWGYDFDPGSNVVDVYVRYLRQKIGSSRLETVRGMGYRLVSRADKSTQ